MKCPHLFAAEDNIRKCRSMAEARMNNALSDFDVQTYCDKNPGNCFYFRNVTKQVMTCHDKIHKNLKELRS